MRQKHLPPAACFRICRPWEINFCVKQKYLWVVSLSPILLHTLHQIQIPSNTDSFAHLNCVACTEAYISKPAFFLDLSNHVHSLKHEFEKHPHEQPFSIFHHLKRLHNRQSRTYIPWRPQTPLPCCTTAGRCRRPNIPFWGNLTWQKAAHSTAAVQSVRLRSVD